MGCASIAPGMGQGPPFKDHTMSVMLISAAQINALTSWAALRAPHTPAHVGGHWVKFGTDRPQIACELHLANARAFTARYGERVDPGAFKPELVPAAASLSTGQVYQLLASLEYNSEDGPDWETSDARSHCQQLLKALAQTLPGYKGARLTIESCNDVADLIGLAA